MRACLLVLTALAALLAACGGQEPHEAVSFLQANGTLVMGGSRVDLAFTIDDVAFFGPAAANGSDDILDLSMRSEDGLTWLSLQLLGVEGRGDHPLDSGADGRLTVLLGPDCEGGQGDLLNGDCRWYSSDFPGSNCTVYLDAGSRETVAGRVECAALAANCPRGTSRDADGACLAGDRLAPLSASLTFALRQPG